MSLGAKIPDLAPVDGSSNVAAAGHDGKSLFIRFHRKTGTAVYRFDGVSDQEYRDLMRAESVGQHFWSKIIQSGRFVGVKVEENA